MVCGDCIGVPQPRAFRRNQRTREFRKESPKMISCDFLEPKCCRGVDEGLETWDVHLEFWIPCITLGFYLKICCLLKNNNTWVHTSCCLWKKGNHRLLKDRSFWDELLDADFFSTLRHSDSLPNAPVQAAEPFVGGCWRINFSRVDGRGEGECQGHLTTWAFCQLEGRESRWKRGRAFWKSSTTCHIFLLL